MMSQTTNVSDNIPSHKYHHGTIKGGIERSQDQQMWEENNLESL